MRLKQQIMTQLNTICISWKRGINKAAVLHQIINNLQDLLMISRHQQTGATTTGSSTTSTILPGGSGMSNSNSNKPWQQHSG